MTSDSPFTAKGLQQRSGLKPATFRRELKALCSAFIAVLETQPDFLDFRQLEHYLVVDGRHASLAIRCQLPVTPQLGEGIEIGFVSGFTGSDAYYMVRLLSDYTEGAIITYVYLKPGYYTLTCGSCGHERGSKAGCPLPSNKKWARTRCRTTCARSTSRHSGQVLEHPYRCPHVGDKGREQGTKIAHSAIPGITYFPFCPLKCPPKNQKPHLHSENRVYCRERGIRTPGGLTLNGFQDRRNRPLCQLSRSVTSTPELTN